MAWNDAVVTIKGIALLQQVLEGATLILDRASGGAGTVPPAGLMAQTALVNEKQTFTIVKATNVPNGKKLHIMISNRDLSIGYSLQQVGIWAHVGDGNSVLFAILQDTAGISIPSEGEAQDFAMNIYAVVNFSNDSEFSVEIDPSTLVSMATLNEALFEYRKFVVAGGTATDIVLPNVTYEDGFSITFIVSEDNDEEDTIINGKPLYKPGTAVTPRLIAGKAVTIWYDSSDECFYVADYIGDALMPGTQGGIGDIIPTNADLLGGKDKEYFEALVDAVSQRVTENLTAINTINNNLAYQDAVEIPLANGWTGELWCKKNNLGQVVMWGTINPGAITAGTFVATIPIAFKPSSYYALTVYCTSDSKSYTGMFISPVSGNLIIRNPMAGEITASSNQIHIAEFYQV